MKTWHKIELSLRKAWVVINPFPFVNNVEFDENGIKCESFASFPENVVFDVAVIFGGSKAGKLDATKYCKKYQTKECPYFKKKHKESYWFCCGTYYPLTVILENGKRNQYGFHNKDDAKGFKQGQIRRYDYNRDRTNLNNSVSNRDRIELVEKIESEHERFDDYRVVRSYAEGDNWETVYDSPKGKISNTISKLQMWRELNEFIKSRIAKKTK